MQRLVLIDGNAILYRAFHALPETLTLKDGSPVNAVYGFTSMLLGVIEKLKPNYLICAFDLPKPTFRDKMYEDYRAQRPPTPEKLIAQIEMVKSVVRAFKIPICEVEGYEADDVIGSLAFQAKNLKLKAQSSKLKNTTKNSKLNTHKNPLHITHDSLLETIIVTGDKDLLQLVNKYTKVYIPIKGLSQAKLYGKKEVEEKYGIKPEQMVDYKALVGDPSDNYPGVKGIGPKTAAELVKKLNTLENIYKEIDKKHPRSRVSLVKKRVADALIEYEQDALMAKRLARIVTDVPVELNLKIAKVSRFDTLEVKELFDKLSFKTLWGRVKESQRSPHQNKSGAGQAPVKGKNYSSKLKAKKNGKNERQEEVNQLTIGL
jgi:DNA polymerase-1